MSGIQQFWPSNEIKTALGVSPADELTKEQALERITNIRLALQPWQLVSDGLPSTAEHGNYPQVEVVLQCVSNDGFMSQVQTRAIGELRFVGGQKDKPFWVRPKGLGPGTGDRLENDSWMVTHWRPQQMMPAPINIAKNAYHNAKGGTE